MLLRGGAAAYEQSQLAYAQTQRAVFGLLAVELAVQLTASQGSNLTHILAAAFFVVSFIFVYRSFYGMRIRGSAA